MNHVSVWMLEGSANLNWQNSATKIQAECEWNDKHFGKLSMERDSSIPMVCRKCVCVWRRGMPENGKSM